LSVKKKKYLPSKIISIAEEVANKNVRLISTDRNRKKIVKSEVSAITVQEFLSGTEDLLKYYHAEV